MYTPYRGSLTPRFPVKRKLVYTTPRPGFKRARFASKLNGINKRTVSGPSKRGTLFNQVRSLQRVVKQILPETKNIDISIANTNIATGATVNHLTAIAQGVTESSRVGEDITLRKLVIKVGLNEWTTTNSTSVPKYHRLFLVKDKQQISDTSPAYTDIFTTNDPMSAMPLTANAERFVFLYTSPLISTNDLVQGTKSPAFEYSWSGTLRVGFNGTASTDIQKNGLYLVLLTTDSGGFMDLTGTVRLQFTDG